LIGFKAFFLAFIEASKSNCNKTSSSSSMSSSSSLIIGDSLSLDCWLFGVRADSFEFSSIWLDALNSAFNF
jgi:hypothetical protein